MIPSRPPTLSLLPSFISVLILVWPACQHSVYPPTELRVKGINKPREFVFILVDCLNGQLLRKELHQSSGNKTHSRGKKRTEGKPHIVGLAVVCLLFYCAVCSLYKRIDTFPLPHIYWLLSRLCGFLVAQDPAAPERLPLGSIPSIGICMFSQAVVTNKSPLFSPLSVNTLSSVHQ